MYLIEKIVLYLVSYLLIFLGSFLAFIGLIVDSLWFVLLGMFMIITLIYTKEMIKES